MVGGGYAVPSRYFHETSFLRNRCRLIPLLRSIVALRNRLVEHIRPSALEVGGHSAGRSGEAVRLVDAGGAPPGDPVAIDRILPGEEFLDGERVAARASTSDFRRHR